MLVQSLSALREKRHQGIDRNALSPTHLNVLCPAGIGDFYWIWCKWSTLAKTRPVKFWFPDGEQHRAHQFASLVGAEWGYLNGLTTPYVWGEPGEPIIPPNEGDSIVIHPNRHLEAGRHLNNWYPYLPLIYPHLHFRSARRASPPYCMAFICHGFYMGGNLTPAAWGRILTYVHKTIAPVKLVGAGPDVAFIHEVLKHYAIGAGIPHLLNRSYREVLQVAQGAKVFFGVAGGPIIAASSVGVPSYQAYPSHLMQMPGTWEPSDVKHGSCSISDLEEAICLKDVLQTIAHISS